MMCQYFCIRFVSFTFNGKNLTDFTNSFLPTLITLKKSDKGILNYYCKLRKVETRT